MTAAAMWTVGSGSRGCAPPRHGHARSLRGWIWRDASQHQLLAGELVVVRGRRPDIVLAAACLWLLLHTWILDGIGWIWIKWNRIGLDWISETNC